MERAIQYVRHSFFAARPFTTLADFNRQALDWREHVAHQRPWPGDDARTVIQAFEEEKPHLLPLPAHPFSCDMIRTVYADKTLWVRFDLNDYSVRPQALGHALTHRRRGLPSAQAQQPRKGWTWLLAHYGRAHPNR